MNEKKILKFVFLLLLMLSSGSCVFDKLEDVSTGVEPVKVVFSTRAFTQDGVTFSAFRLIAFNTAGSVEINKTLDDLVPSGNNLTMDLRPGIYTLFAVGNELSDMSPALDAASSESDVDAVRINRIENRDSSSLPVAWKRTIYVRQKTLGSNIGQLSLNNKDWLDHMDIETERLASKLEFYVRKENPLDVVSVKIVTPKNMPKYSFVTPMAYNGEYYSTPLSMNHTVTDDLTLLIDRIYPEHIPSASQNETFVELDMNVNGEDIKASVPVGQLDRNKIYRYEVLVKSRGIKIEFENIQVLPWNDVETDQSVDGVEFNLSDVEVPYSYGQESKVYFTTKNIHPDNLRLSSGVYDSNDGTTIVGNLYDFFDASTDYTYSYDAETRIGRGELTIKRKKVSLDKHRINIYASGLTRSILVDGLDVAGSNIYWDSSRNRLAFDDTPPDGVSSPNSSFVGVYVGWGKLAVLPALPVGTHKFYNASFIWSSTGEKALSDNLLLSVTKASELINDITPLDPDRGIGDLCEYMTRRGYAPKNKKWRYPCIDEMRLTYKYSENIISSQINPNGDFMASGFFIREGSELTIPATPTIGLHGDDIYVYATTTEPSLYNIRYDEPTGSAYVIDACARFRRSDSVTSFSKGSNILRPSFAGFNSLRCVVDDSPGEVIPLYMLSYDLSGGEAGTITVPTPEGMIKNQHADPGGSIKLSKVVLTSSAGRIHNGWIINGKEYELGAAVSNILSDMKAKPRWR